MAATIVALSSSTSDVSLMSLDPGIAREINNNSTLPTLPIEEHARDRRIGRGQTLRGTSTANQSDQLYRSTSARHNTRQRARTNSLRHVKNSTEMLKQKSLRRQKVDQTSETLTLKEGRHFTVGNVGNNGRIYLR